MINYLELGAETLLDRMTQYGGKEIMYTRKGAVPLRFTAVPSRVVTNNVDENGVLLRQVTFDFVFGQEHLKDLDPPRPSRNDEIRVVDAGKVEELKGVFSVNGEDNATSHYEEADSYGKAWRVHCKRDRNA